MKKIIIGLLIGLPILAVGIITIYLASLDHTDLQPMMSEALGPEFTAEMKSASVLPFRREIRIGSLQIRSATNDYVIFQSDTLTVSGLGLTALLRDRLSINDIKMENFSLAWDDALTEEENDEARPFETVAIRNLDLANGTITMHVNGQEQASLTEFNLLAGFELNLANSAASSNNGHLIQIDSLGCIFDESRYRLSISGLELEQGEQRFSLSSLSLTPRLDFEDFMDTLEYREDMMDVQIENLNIYQLDIAALLQQDLLKADSIEVGALELHISTDLHLERDPEADNPKLINQIVQDLPVALQLGVLSIQDTDIRYSERAEKGVRPGTISFLNSQLTIRDIDTQSEQPAQVNAVTYLENHSEVNTELELTLGEGPLQLSGSGSLSSFDMTLLNTMLRDLMGIEISSGELHDFAFDITMHENESKGTIRAIYEDFEILPIDQEDHTAGFGQELLGFAITELPLRSNNLPDDNGEPTDGDIDHERDPQKDPFFKYFAESLLSGLIDIFLRIPADI